MTYEEILKIATLKLYERLLFGKVIEDYQIRNLAKVSDRIARIYLDELKNLKLERENVDTTTR